VDGHAAWEIERKIASDRQGLQINNMKVSDDSRNRDSGK